MAFNQKVKAIYFEQLILFFAVFVALISGYLFYVSKDKTVSLPQIPVIENEIEKFQKLNPPLKAIELNKYLSNINPSNLLANYNQYTKKQLIFYKSITNSCNQNNLKNRINFYNNSHSIDEWLDKTLLFQKIVCFNSTLPESFWETGPLIHPSGKSFALLYFEKLLKTNQSRPQLQIWINQHISKFHLLELKFLVENKFEVSKDFPLKQLMLLSWPKLYQISKNEELIIDSNIVLIRSAATDYQYSLYSIETWNTFWKQSLLHPTLIENSDTSELLNSCFATLSQVCWQYDFNKVFWNQWNPVVPILFCSILLSIFLFLYLAYLIYLRKKEGEQLKFALDMMTHELRTPLTNLNLHAEELRSHYHKLPHEAQNIVLRILDQLARVLRLTNLSTNYLNNKNESQLIHTNWVITDDLNEYISNCITEFSQLNEIDMQYIFKDERKSKIKDVKIEPYWTMICIQNLLSNAVRHGTPPISVTATVREHEWEIEVLDRGIKKFDVKVKSQDSPGLGNGLKLVNRILPYINATLLTSYNPTCFKIVLLRGEQ